MVSIQIRDYLSTRCEFDSKMLLCSVLGFLGGLQVSFYVKMPLITSMLMIISMLFVFHWQIRMCCKKREVKSMRSHTYPTTKVHALSQICGEQNFFLRITWGHSRFFNQLNKWYCYDTFFCPCIGYTRQIIFSTLCVYYKQFLLVHHSVHATKII